MKPERNNPCPCGSGKKYKKCCLLKEIEQDNLEQQEWEKWFKEDWEEGDKRLAKYEAELKARGVYITKENI